MGDIEAKIKFRNSFGVIAILLHFDFWTLAYSKNKI